MPSWENDKLLSSSAWMGDHVDVAARLAAGAHPDSYDTCGRTPLHLAACGGRSECVDILLPVSDPLSGDHDGMTPLMFAAGNGHTGCASALLPVSDPCAADFDGWTALMHAAAIGSVECVRMLLPVSDHLASDHNGFTALMLAVEMGRADCASVIRARVLSMEESSVLDNSVCVSATPASKKGPRV